jgi:hypothetical protein
MNGVPDHLLVWSDVMSREAIEYHDYPEERIRWTGAAQFDHYHRHRERFDRGAWRRERGIPEDAALIMYGTINPTILPHEFEIVRQLATALESGCARRRSHLWIRLHPQMVKGPDRTSVEPYRSLAGSQVTVEEPPVQSSQLDWDLPRDDALHLANLLAASDVVVTPCSTLVIDAACMDTPVISILYDGPSPVPSELSARRFARYTHYEKLLAAGGVALVYDIEQCIKQIGSYLEDPSLHGAGRKAVIAQQLEVLDGRSAQRTADALLELAGACRERTKCS